QAHRRRPAAHAHGHPPAAQQPAGPGGRVRARGAPVPGGGRRRRGGLPARAGPAHPGGLAPAGRAQGAAGRGARRPLGLTSGGRPRPRAILRGPLKGASPMRTYRHAAAAALALAVAVPVLAEDVTITYKLTEDGQPKGTTTTYVSSEHYRVQSPDTDMIFDYGPGRMVMIDHKKKEYWETTSAELNAQMAQMNAKMEESQKQMQAQMQNMPPAVREKMQAMMGGIAQSVTVTPGTGSKTVAGYETHPYTVAMGDLMKNELWTADIAFPQPALDARNNFMALSNPMMKNMDKMVAEMKKIKGVPLAENTTVKVMGRTKTTGKEATEVKKGAIAPSVFAVPTGYAKVESPLAKMAKSPK